MAGVTVRDSYGDVLILYDMATTEFSSHIPELAPNFVDIFFGARSNGSTSVNLRGFKKVSIEVVSGISPSYPLHEYPPSNTTLISSDQEYLTSFRIMTQPEAELTIITKVKLVNGDEHTHSIPITIPRPPQPYPSWTWDAALKRWIPPVPYPDDGGRYVWDESTLSWVPAPEPILETTSE
jgi:hypothetical protein